MSLVTSTPTLTPFQHPFQHRFSSVQNAPHMIQFLPGCGDISVNCGFKKSDLDRLSHSLETQEDQNDQTHLNRLLSHASF